MLTCCSSDSHPSAHVAERVYSTASSSSLRRSIVRAPRVITGASRAATGRVASGKPRRRAPATFAHPAPYPSLMGGGESRAPARGRTPGVMAVGVFERPVSTLAARRRRAATVQQPFLPRHLFRACLPPERFVLGGPPRQGPAQWEAGARQPRGPRAFGLDALASRRAEKDPKASVAGAPRRLVEDVSCCIGLGKSDQM